MDAMTQLERLADEFGGSIVLRSYNRNSLLCDTLPGRLLGHNGNGEYAKVDGKLWAVLKTKRPNQLLGVGNSPEEAIAAATDAVRKIPRAPVVPPARRPMKGAAVPRP